jgi:sialate O-acetylesterase
MKRRLACLLLIAGVGCARPGPAVLELASVFGDHAVLQRDASVPVWGTSEPKVPVTVAFAGQTKTTAADAAGAWRVRLDPLAVSSEPRQLVVCSGAETQRVSDVLVGEVWLAAGQANMRQGSPPAAELPEIRYFDVGAAFAPTPRKSLRSGRWHIHSTNEVASLSEMAGLFARRLHAETRSPVGVIVAARDSTDAEKWMNREALALFPGFSTEPTGEELRRQVEVMDLWDRRQNAYDAAWEGMRLRLRHVGRTASDEEEAALMQPVRAQTDRLLPWGDEEAKVYNMVRSSQGCVYNGMIAPLVPYAIRGVLWSQGEWDGGAETRQYFYRLAPLIAGWRVAWNQGAFPFVYAQTQDMAEGEEAPTPPEPAWYSGVREGQRLALQLPNTAMAVTFDVCHGLHPPQRAVAADRLARLALATVYGRGGPTAPSGPLYDSVTVEGNRLRVRFKYAGGGLVLHEASGAALPFVIRGEGTEFMPAEAKVEGSDLLLSNRALEKPAAARYAWARPLVAVLFGVNGLPASPFATDQFCTADFVEARALRDQWKEAQKEKKRTMPRTDFYESSPNVPVRPLGR